MRDTCAWGFNGPLFFPLNFCYYPRMSRSSHQTPKKKPKNLSQKNKNKWPLFFLKGD